MDLTQERRIVTDIPGPRSRELLERRKAAVPKGIASTAPIFTEAASGAIIRDVDGNQLIDLGAGLAVLNVGNSAPAVVEAVRAQLDKFTHTCMHVTMSEPYIELAERLNALVPGPGPKQTMFVNSGAEATENAVKLSRYFTGRPAVAVFDHAFHGRTLMAMTMTAKAMPYKQGFGPFAPEVYRLPMSYPYRCPTGESYDDCGPRCADAAITMIDKQIGAEKLACVLIEPQQGEGGFIVPGDGFIPKLAEYCAANGIVFIADEVQTGFGRTGKMFGIEWEGVEPDLVTSAKSLAGGLPLAAVTGRAEILDVVHVGGLGGTYGGNPLATSAALAVLDTIERDGLVDRAARIGELMTERLLEMSTHSSLIGDLRGRGAMVAIELVDDRSTKHPAKEAASRVIEECYKQGVIVLKAGTFDNVIRFLPPLTIEESLLLEGFDVVEKALATAEAEAR
jgi:4-aminobutyrate aminotransferase / (S)-3-amino-2-methylpropionate transaminase / 5-aminovalerate transaminase